MTDAQCCCGALTLRLPEPSKLVIACHCLDCQRRTGAPFSVGAFYPVDAVAISGTPKEFTRDAASDRKVHFYFCPNGGSTIYWKADGLPSLIGVAVGALADPKYPAPVRSVFEQSNPGAMRIFHATAEETTRYAPPATAFVVAKDADEVMMLLAAGRDEPEGVILSAVRTTTVQINPRPPSAMQ